MLDLFLYGQITVCIGAALYLACCWLFRLRRWLPLTVGWFLIICLFITAVAGGYGFIVMMFMQFAFITGGFFSLFGTFFFFALDEKHKDRGLAFFTLLPLTILCKALSVMALSQLNPQVFDDHVLPFLVISAIAPNLAAFVVWLYRKICKPAEKE